MPSCLEELVAAWHSGCSRGIYSVCSAHPWALEAAIEQALEDGTQLLVEATSNQVNHRGGYTGMQPADFRRLVEGVASAKGLGLERLILGGDHLGPNPWQTLPAAEAMGEAERMVDAYARAGFTKIHLDASMACGGEPGPLSDETIAERAARLCAVAEQASGERKPVYVIGTEVPVPGGATESLSHLEPTRREAAAKTLEVHHRIFAGAGLAAAWPRAIALVVQPGVEFNHQDVVDYNAARARHLPELLRREPGRVYEAHSTDYQRPSALKELVRDGFAILKVGPALTFALREALRALEQIEVELVEPRRRSCLMGVLEQAMLDNPQHWKHHYSGDARTMRLLRRYSYSDRVRYYWAVPEVRDAVAQLDGNLKETGIPETMLSAYLPRQYKAVRSGRLRPEARAIAIDRIRDAIRPYAEACWG